MNQANRRWNTTRWLLRTLILTAVVFGFYALLDYNSTRPDDSPTSKKIIQMAKARHQRHVRQSTPVSSVQNPKMRMAPWQVLLMIFSNVIILSAAVELWGWKPVLQVALVLTVIGIIVVVIGFVMESRQQKRYISGVDL